MSTKVRRTAPSLHGVAAYKERLMAAIQQEVDVLLVDERIADDLADPQEVAAIMIAAVPRMHSYDALVGPFFTADAVGRKLGGISRQAVHERAKRKTLLQVKTSDNVALYPAFQFDGDVVPDRVSKTISAFRDAPVDGWTIATWFSVPAGPFDGLTPREWLADRDRDLEPVLEYAHQVAQQWSAP